MSTHEQQPARPRPAMRLARRSGDGSGQTKESAVVARASIRRRRGAVERWSAYIILLVSFVGTIVALHPGRWLDIFALQFSLYAVCGGILLQGLLTWLQWAYSERWRVAWTARLIDAVCTAWGFGPLILLLAGITLPDLRATVLFYVGFTVVCLFPAWYPENRLVTE